MEKELLEDAADVPELPDKSGGGAEADDGLVGGEHGSAEGGPGEHAGDREAENERPTVSPPFDPIAFARDILKPSPQPMPAVRPRTADAHTKATPAGGIEAPRPTSRRTPLGVPALPSGAARTPRLTPPPQQARRKTPTSTLSLANARIPSNLPPPRRAKSDAGVRPAGPKPARTESVSAMNPVDREWADLEVATRPPPPNLDLGADDELVEPSDVSTRPPPADGPEEDPVIEIARDRPPPEIDDVTPVAADVEERSLARAFGHDGAIDDFSDEHGADTVRRPLPGAPEDEDTRAREMGDRVSLGDYSGALEIAEKILAENAGDAAARACADNCRTVLRQMYATRIGPLDRVPVVMVPRDQLRWLSIDHRAGFVLSLVDGVSTLEMIIDVSGMAELDTLRILSELAQQRIISLR